MFLPSFQESFGTVLHSKVVVRVFGCRTTSKMMDSKVLYRGEPVSQNSLPALILFDLLRVAASQQFLLFGNERFLSFVFLLDSSILVIATLFTLGGPG